MKIAITGGSGFIGQMLLKKHLELGDEVHVLSRREPSEFSISPNLFCHKGDLLDINSLESFLFETDVLYHCAAEIYDESKMQAVNVDGTINLLKVGTGKIKHWVQLSSVGVYGPVDGGIITENHLYNPINPYEKTKLQSDLLVMESGVSNGFTFAVIRPSNVFGSEMRNSSLFQLIKMINSGYYFFIGPRGASANYIAVSNVVQALFLAATHPKAKNEIFNISSWTTMENFIAMIAKELERPLPKYRVSLTFIKMVAELLSVVPKNPLTVSRVKALSNRSIYSTSKIINQLGYKEEESLETAIGELVGSYKKGIIYVSKNNKKNF